MPPPKAISQGSNGAGGGAFTALTAISAARAEPDTIASAVANKASFFMTVPITLLDSQFRGPPPGQAITDCGQMSKRSHRVVWGVTIVKQKRQASAAFLGVQAVPIDVLRVCCILTTILRGFASPARYRERENSSGDRPAES